MQAQGAVQHLQPLLRAFSTSNAVSAAPALVPKSGGFLSSIFGGGSRIDVPLNEPLPSVAQPPRNGIMKSAPVLQTTQLSAGTKLATLDSVSPVSSLGLFLQGGSSFETSATMGASKVLEAIAFKSATTNRTTFRLTRELEKLGATASCVASREHLAFSIDFVKLNSREAVEMLVDSVVNAKYSYWEVRDSLDVVKEQLATAMRNPNTVLTEILHRAAYDGSLANSLIVDPSQVSDFSSDALLEYLHNIGSPSSGVLAGVGVEHGEIQTLANPMMSVTKGGPSGSSPVSKYAGGSLSVLAPTAPATHVALAFEVKGGASDAKTAALASVVKAMLDEARPTLPHSRKESTVFATITPFAHLYRSSGLVGLSASSTPAKANELVDAVCKKMEAIASGPISEGKLAQAKALALGEHKAKIATSAGLLSVAGSCLLATGRFDASELPSKVNALTAADVSAFVKALLKSPASMATYGNLSSLPRVDLSKRFA